MLTGLALLLLGLAGGMFAWKAQQPDRPLTLANVVAAVSSPGKVFHAVCGVTADGRTTGSVEQWFSPDLAASRTEVATDGRVVQISVVTTGDAATVSFAAGASSGTLKGFTSASNASGLPLDPAILNVHPISELATLKAVAFTRVTASGGTPAVEASGTWTRPADSAGEDDPAGGILALRWNLNRVSLLPIDASGQETRPDGSKLPKVDVVCTTAELLDASAVDPAMFDIDALKKRATRP
jgi:hypothetical protein